jgi:glycosyltransferase involved in cell wall biosynthesis
MRIAVVTPIPTPYRDAFWNVISAQPGVDLHLLYCAWGKADRPWKNDWPMRYPHTFLKGWNLLAWKAMEASLYLNPVIIRSLSSLKPDAIVIGGYNHFTMWMAMFWARLTHTPYFLMCETHKSDNKKGILKNLRTMLLKWIARTSNGALPTGQQASLYLQEYGWEIRNLFELPNIPDIEAIESITRSLHQQKKVLRNKWGVKNQRIIVCVGRLVQKKHVDHLIKSFAQLKTAYNVRLVIVGNGDQEEILKQLCRQQQVTDRVQFTGFLDPQEILEWLTISEIFALASNETWGVAPIEAAAAGKFILLSSGVGSATDLAKRYAHLKIIAHGNMQAWKNTLEHALKKTGKEHEKLSENKNLSPWHLETQACQFLNYLKNTSGIGGI